MPERAVRVFVGGDICPVGRMAAPFARGDAEGIFGDLLPLIRSCDLAVANLEAPLAPDGVAPIAKSGPNLRAPMATASTLARAGFTAVGLANNHILDFGAEGLRHTRAACEAAGVMTFGAGPDLASARRPWIATCQGLRIAFLAVAEDERCLAGEARAGAAPVDPLWVVRTLSEHRDQYDRLVVLLHGGNEGFPYPAPWLRETCRFLAEQGADLVVCQHSHCVGSLESHGRGTLLYGQGNFIFDYPGHGTEGDRGLALVLTFEADRPVQVGLHPFARTSDGTGVRCSEGPAGQDLLDRLEAQSAVLRNPARYAGAWEGYCQSRTSGYLARLQGHGRWLSRLNRGEWMFRHLTGADFLRMYNLVACESHREALRTSLDALIERGQGGRPS